MWQWPLPNGPPSVWDTALPCEWKVGFDSVCAARWAEGRALGAVRSGQQWGCRRLTANCPGQASGGRRSGSRRIAHA